MDSANAKELAGWRRIWAAVWGRGRERHPELWSSRSIGHYYSAFDFRDTEVPAKMGEVERTDGTGNRDQVNFSGPGNENRDGDLKSPNYFDAAQFSTITFKSKSVSKNGEGKLKVVGDLTIHGVTKEVTLDVDGPSAPLEQRGNKRRGLSATTSINRKDFGVGAKAPAVMVGEDIKIDIDAELTQKGAAAPAAK